MRKIHRHHLIFALLTLALAMPLSHVFAQEAAVSGRVFYDVNGDGMFDAGEKPVEGAELVLISTVAQAENVFGLTKSGLDGQYQFSSIPGGEYYLSVSLPDGLLFAQPAVGGSAALPASGSKSRTMPFNLDAGELAVKDIGAGKRDAYINVIAFGDENMNGGRFSSEPLLKGVEVSLVFDWEGERHVVVRAVTDKEGFAQLRDLTPAVYRLSVRMPEPYIIGPLGQKINPFFNVIPPTDSNEGTSEPFHLERSLGVGVGGVKSGSLTGRVWYDADMNGRVDEAERGFPGIEITLAHVGLGVSRTIVTDETAGFSFDHLQPGTYRFSAALPDGVMFAPEGSPSLFTEGFTDSQSAEIEITEGLVTALDPVGVMPASGITVIAFHDTNVNGMPDEGEPAFSGAVAEAVSRGQTVQSSVTDSEGKAVLTRVRSGEAVVRVRLPDGQVFSVNGGEAGNAFHSVSATSAITVKNRLEHGGQLTLFAGVTLPSSVSGALFEDTNLSGVLESGEGFLSGFTVQAIDGGGNIAAEAQTDSGGQYTLDSLVPASYTLRFQLVSPYVFSEASGAGEAFANQVISQTPAYGETGILTLQPGQSLQSVDAGAFRSAVINGSVLLGDDEVGFGGKSGGLPGVVIELVYEDGAPFSEHTVTATDSQGSFSLKGALPGTYRLRYSLPEHAKFSRPMTDESLYLSEALVVKASDVIDVEPFFAVRTGILAGLAYQDTDNDGSQSDGDLSLPGASIQLKNEKTGEIYSAISAMDGLYEISGVRPGLYVASVQLPEGFVLDTNARSVVPAALTGGSMAKLEIKMSDRIIDSVLSAVRPVALQGVVFYDHDLNKRYDAQTDSPYPAPFTLKHLRTNTTFSLEADAKGVFLQDPVFPGIYEITLSLPEDHLLTAPGQPRQDGSVWTATVQLDGSFANLELPVIQWAALSGTVWNMDGSMDGVNGITVKLMESQGNLVQEALTDEGGRFSFAQLLPIQYSMVVQLPQNYRFAREVDTANRGSVITSEPAGTESAGESSLFKLDMGERREGQDVGIGAMGKLGDYAWLDLDGDGMQDAGEPGIPDIRIRLYQYGQLAGQADTDNYGRYLFTGLYPGVYRLEADVPDEIKPTKNQSEFPLVASVLIPAEEGVAFAEGIIVPSGGRNLNCDLGFVLLKEGRLPDSLLHLPQKDWTRVNEQSPRR